MSYPPRNYVSNTYKPPSNVIPFRSKELIAENERQKLESKRLRIIKAINEKNLLLKQLGEVAMEQELAR